VSRPLEKQGIAIIGIGCRLPGGASNPLGFWRLLENGSDALGPSPRFRTPDFLETAWQAAFVEGMELFDASFFGLSGQAADLDPRHRVVLEVAWEALEDAGIDPRRLPPEETGAFLGMYGERYESSDPLGVAPGMAVARLCHFFDLKGPALTIDTTCSSSLVALHEAVTSLRNGDCRVALSGGANLIASPVPTTGGFAAVDGRSKAFDASADGLGQGEGCVLLVLKRTGDAIVDGDRIYACVSGSAINHDGRSSSLTAPNPASQERVIRRAIQQAGMCPDEVQYVEAHGTGTRLGDPIEMEGLVRAFGSRRSEKLAIGSVKTNVGHLEAAAGATGVAKLALAIYHRRLPPSLHFDTPSPFIEWDEIPIRVQTSLSDWPSPDDVLVGGVSSFGMSGTNAHAVLSEPPLRSSESPLQCQGGAAGESCDGSEHREHVVPLSAKSSDALRNRISEFCSFLEDRSRELCVADLAYTAGCRRPHFDTRTSVMGANRDDLVSQLNSAAGRTFDNSRPKDPTRVCMVFCGQGPQWYGMAQQLLREEPVFAGIIGETTAVVERFAEWNLLEELERPEASSRLLQAEIGQPAMFALQIGLLGIWNSWGVKPAAVVGHSLGEVAAAYAAGTLSLEDAVRIVCHRGRIMGRLAGSGRMVQVALSKRELDRVLAASKWRLEIAAENAPNLCTLTGDSFGIERIVDEMQSRGVAVQVLAGDSAFHSLHVESLCIELEKALGAIAPAEAGIDWVSSMTGESAPSPDVSYWAEQMRKPVRFRTATEELIRLGYSLFIEVGPHPVLRHPLRETGRQSKSEIVVLASQNRNLGGRHALLSSFGALYEAGFPVNWSLQHAEQRNVVSFPTYPWEHRSFWRRQSRARGTNGVEGTKEETSALVRGTDEAVSLGEMSSLACVVQTVRWSPLAESSVQPERKSQRSAGWTPTTMQGSDGLAWLLFEGQGGTSTPLRAELESRGIRILSVRSGVRYRRTDSGDFEIDFSERSHVSRLMGEVTSGSEPDRVIYMAGSCSIVSENESSDFLEQSISREFLSALHVVQAIQSARWIKSVRLTLVTCGACSADGGVPGIAQAPLWGLGASVAREIPSWSVSLVDADPEAVDFSRLADAISVGGETRIAQRGDRLLVPRLVPYSTGQTASGRGTTSGTVRSDRMYIVSGGLGALGLIAARELAGLGARHIALLGRNPATRAAQAEIDEISRSGIDVQVAQVDVGDYSALGRFLAELSSRDLTLGGVIHSAGAIRDGALFNLGADPLAEVMRGKVLGAWNLHRLAADADLFILFGSVAGVFGNAGQANYAAANAFLEALARHRASLGKAAVCIAWGGWRAGMGESVLADPATTISRETGGAMFRNLLSSPEGLVIAAARSLADFNERGGVVVHKTTPAGKLAATSARKATASGKRRLGVLQYVSELAGLAVENIRSTDTLGGLGIDSLATIRLRARCAEELEVVLAPDEVDTNTSCDALERLVAQRGDRHDARPVRKRVFPSPLWLRDDGEHPPVVLLHPVGGGLSCYKELSSRLPFRVLGIESPALKHGDDYHFETIEEKASYYLSMLDDAAIQPPYQLAGWSLGGLVAYEMARLLSSQGRRPSRIVLIDSHLNHALRPRGEISDENAMLRQFLLDLTRTISPDSDCSGFQPELVSLDSSKHYDLQSRIADIRQHGLLAGLPTGEIERMYLVFRSNLQAAQHYKPSGYDGHVVVISATDWAAFDAPSCASWRLVAPNREEFEIEADHYSILAMPALESLIDLLSVGIQGEGQVKLRVSDGQTC
jgi:acyl transferase domain-containing protein/thioesterase domain-containing protein